MVFVADEGNEWGIPHFLWSECGGEAGCGSAEEGAETSGEQARGAEDEVRVQWRGAGTADRVGRGERVRSDGAGFERREGGGGEVETVGGGGSGEKVRPGRGAGNKRTADPDERGRTRVAVDDASHRVGWVVHRGVVGGVEGIVWDVQARRGRSVAGAEAAVRGLCDVAAEVDGREAFGKAGGVLERRVKGSAGVVGIAVGSCEAGAAGT